MEQLMAKQDYREGKEALYMIGGSILFIIIVFTVLHFVFGIPVFSS